MPGSMRQPNLNAVYSRRTMRRRYEVWFLRFGLANGEGAWWFRYLIMNLGRQGCAGNSRGAPVQMWATWFPRGGAAQTFIQGFAVEGLDASAPGATPFHLALGENKIGEDFCVGRVCSEGHDIRWDLRYRSNFGTTLSDRGWIGFSRTPHSDAVFSGEIVMDGRAFRGELLGYGLQGHNCGYRHRGMWTWTHSIFPGAEGGNAASFEAIEYDMPLGMCFRKGILWSGGRAFEFRQFEKMRRSRTELNWSFEAVNSRQRTRIRANVDGSGASLHRLPYLKTDCSGTFEVSNNSLARATLRFEQVGHEPLFLATDGGAVIEMAGGE
jgi:hypothetical protein